MPQVQSNQVITTSSSNNPVTTLKPPKFGNYLSGIVKNIPLTNSFANPIATGIGAAKGIYDTFKGKNQTTSAPVQPAPTTASSSTMRPSSKGLVSFPGSSNKTVTTSTPTTPPSINATSGAPVVGNQMQNAQNVLNASNLTNNPQYQTLASQNNLLTQAQNNVSTAGTAGAENTINKTGNELLGNRYTDIFRPQSTANLQGEKGILNPYLVNAQAGNTAEAQRLLNAAQLGTQGATTVLVAGAPQLGTAGQVPFNPLTGTAGGFLGGTSGPFQAGQIQGNMALGQNYANMNASNQAAKTIKNTIQQYISQNQNVNPSEFSDVNKALQFLNGKVSNPQYQTLSNYLSEYISTLAPILGVGGDTTNLKTQIAQGMVNAQASGQSISTVLDNIEALAQSKLDAIAQAGQGDNTQSSGSTGGYSGLKNGGAF